MKKLILSSVLCLVAAASFAKASDPLVGTYVGTNVAVNPIYLKGNKISTCTVTIEEIENGSDRTNGPGYQVIMTVDGSEDLDGQMYMVAKATARERINLLGVKSVIYSGAHADMADFIDLNYVNGKLTEIKGTVNLGPIFGSQSCLGVKKVK